MIPIMREAANPRRKRIVAVLGSQMGKTDGQLNIIGQRLDDDPVPVLYVGPTKSNVEKVIEPRIMKMVRAVPSLMEQLATGKASSKTYKAIAGVSLRLAWAGSPTELASQDAALVLVDELDRMKADVGSEGSPLDLAEARFETYADGKSVVTSTPTEGSVTTVVDENGLERWDIAEAEDLASAIWRAWQPGTRFEWAWPCPHCGDYFIPRYKLLVWPEGATPQQAKRQARLRCPQCAALIEDTQKTQMNDRGVYVAPGQSIEKDGTLIGEVEENDTASFWVSGLCSPWRTFGDRARSVVEAQLSGDPEKLKAVLNTRFGELYAVGGDAQPWERIRERIAPYRFGEVPDGVRWITAYADVQKKRLVYAVRGWGFGMESWLLEAGEIWGETEHDQVWSELAAFKEREFGPRNLRIMRMGVDSGYRPGQKFRRPDNQIYAFCRRLRGWAVATKGHDSQEKPVRPSLIDVTFRGKTIKNGLQLWHLDSDYFKSWVQSRFDWPLDQPGQWRVPTDVTDDYCKQVTAEARTVKPSGQAVWIRVRKENHFLDCEAGNVSMAHVLGLHRKRAKRQSPEGVVTAKTETASTAQTERSQPESVAPAPIVEQPRKQHWVNSPRRKNWVRSW